MYTSPKVRNSKDNLQGVTCNLFLLDSAYQIKIKKQQLGIRVQKAVNIPLIKMDLDPPLTCSNSQYTLLKKPHVLPEN